MQYGQSEEDQLQVMKEYGSLRGFVVTSLRN